VVTYEAGEALRLSEKAIVTGIRGVSNAMRAIGMLPAGKTRSAVAHPDIATGSKWLRASTDGMFRPLVELGAQVTKGDALGVVSSPFDSGEEVLTSSVEGIVVGMARQPLVNEGEALCHVAVFEEAEEVEEKISAHGELIETDPLFGIEQVDDVDVV